MTFTRRDDALALLRSLASDSVSMASLRRMAMSLEVTNPSNFGDAEVVNYLATQLTTQRLLVLRQIIVRLGTPGSDNVREQPKPAGAPVRGEKETEPDEPTFSDLLEDDQAAALIGAAQDGVPFCEECARAAQEQAA
jgi:hypothetical protein